jgi:hypothetical protein
VGEDLAGPDVHPGRELGSKLASVAGIVPVHVPSVSQNGRIYMVQLHRIRLGPPSRKVFLMGLRDLFEGSHAIILLLVVVALFG